MRKSFAEAVKALNGAHAGAKSYFNFLLMVRAAKPALALHISFFEI